MSKKAFLEKFKLKKAVGDFKPSLNYGDKLHLFNCLYKVVSMNEDGYTYLEDEKKSRIAISSDKLKLLMMKGMARNYGAINLEKAQIGGASRKIGVMPKAVNASMKQTGSGKPGPQGEPVGTTRQGADGEWYKKVSMAPAQWIHVGRGTSHVTPGSEASHPLTHKEDQEKFLKLRSTIRENAHPDDHHKLETMAMDWANQLYTYKNKLAYHNAGEVDEKSGTKLPRMGITPSNMDEVYKDHNKAIDLKKKLIDAIKESKLRKKE